MRIVIAICLFIMPFLASSQTKTVEKQTEFSSMIDSYLSYTVPLISVEDLDEIKDHVILLDAREKEEYKVSHIAGAVHVGYDNLNEKRIGELDKTKTVVVYCSIGYRSEKIAEVLQKQGFRNVLNLYGSIFEWVNKGKPIVDNNNEETWKIHTYNKKWSKWMVNKNYTKVY